MAKPATRWMHSIGARLVAGSAVIVVLAVLATSGVFVYRERQEQRPNALGAIAVATRNFVVSTSVGPFGLVPPPPLPQAGQPAITVAGDVPPGVVKSEAGGAAGIGTVEFSSASGGKPSYRIILVGRDGQVVSDPAGTLAGVQVGYPQAGTATSSDGYVVWPGAAATSTDGLTFLATSEALPGTTNDLVPIAVIDTSSLTSDWLAMAPDLVLSALVGLPLALGAAVLITRRITRPLRQLTLATNAMALGDFDQRVEVGGRDEVATLASSFTSMATHVRERDAQLRALIANVSHDLRTPLTSIQGYAEAIADGVADPADLERVAGIIRNEARHAGSLLADLLSLSELEAGAVVLRPEVHDLCEAVERCVQRAGAGASARGVHVGIEVPEGATYFGDAEKVERALTNLIDNASRFARSSIEVRGEATAAATTITVSNDGPAIAPIDAARIFDRYYRGTASGGGTGLGLAIARELIELHGGSVELASAAAPVAFRLVLPR